VTADLQTTQLNKTDFVSINKTILGVLRLCRNIMSQQESLHLMLLFLSHNISVVMLISNEK